MFALLQYMGSQMSDRVRLKCIELLYGWSQVLSHEPKVKEAYQMMKRQGIIKYDPVHIDKVGILCHFIIFSEKNRIRHLCSAKDTDLAQRSLYFHCTSKSESFLPDSEPGRFKRTHLFILLLFTYS